MKRRLLSMALALVMVFMLLPATALADGESYTENTYEITVDEVTKIAEHGQTLGEVLGSENVLYKDADGSNTVYYCDFIIMEALNLEKVDIAPLTLSEYNGAYYLNIASVEGLNKFASLVNETKLTGINGMLTSDISAVDNHFQTIGCQRTEDPEADNEKAQGVNYTGTFDGQYHTINVVIDTEAMAQGVFGAIADGAVIRNLIVDGSVIGGYGTAGIAGMARGGTITIENCINKADVTVVSGSDAAGILGTNLSSTEVIIRNCGNIGNIEDTDTDGAYAAAISAWLGDNSSVENCYNTGSVTGVDLMDYSEGFARGNYDLDGVKLTNNYTNNEDARINGLNKASNDAFKSGEVCYKLNQGQDATVWFQTCGEDYPILNGAASAQTVYYGYETCTSEEPVYSNADTVRGAKGHDLVHHDAQTETCTDIGWDAYDTCTRCEYTTYAEIEALGHDYAVAFTVDTQPTCTEEGSKSKHCTRCDATTDATAIPANGHSWDEGTVTTEATCTTDGEKLLHCTACEETKTEAIDALGHNYASEFTVDQAATCTEEGSKSKHCTRCEDKTDATVIPATGHSWDEGTVTTEATCTEGGEKTFHCTACDATKTEVMKALGHNLVDDTEIPATCTEAGKEAGKHCSRCDYTEGGAVIEKLGHTEVIDEAVAATCTNTGLTEGKHCSVCNDILVAQQEIPALGHTFGEWQIVTAATRTQAGEKKRVCSVCGAEETAVIPATGGAYTPSDTRPAAPTPTPAKWQNPFVDVFERDWFYDDVRFAYENELMNGTGGRKFSPSVTTTRGMIVTILYRLEGEPYVSSASPFDDVKFGSYYEKAITWAAKNGIVDGYGSGKFGPDDAITREQLAAILWRYAKYKGYDVSVGENTNILSYADAFDISGYAYAPLQWACGEGLINGYNGTLTPTASAIRAQVAAILHRFFDKFVK